MRKVLKITLWSLGAVITVPALGICAWLIVMAAREETPPTEEVPHQSAVYDPAYSQAAEQALVLLRESQRRRHFPSVAMAVGVQGKLVWAGAVGYEEVATGRRATVDSRYYIASVAKFFTSIALGKLIEQGVLDFDASFRAAAPDFPPMEHDFTLRQLQTHAAGIRHWRVMDVFNNRDYRNVREAAADLEHDALLFEPGTNTAYSTPGYTLLALAMERATGQSYLDIMQQQVFSPAGMHDIFADSAQRPVDNVVVPYLVHETANMRVPSFNLSDRWAGGGFLATPSDVVRFGNAVLVGDMVSRAYRVSLLQRQPGEDDANSDRYPRSFAAESGALGLKLTGGGSGWGGRASLSLYPAHGIVVAIATNARPSDNQGPGIDEDQVAMLFNPAVE